jgi:hypothetical protein
LSGVLVGQRGEPVRDVPVCLWVDAVPGCLTTTTSSDGTFRFAALPSGPVELYVGRLETPIVPVRRLELDRSPLQLDPIVVPGLHDAEIQVLDAHGTPVSGARIEGVGQRGGGFAGETDSAGRLRVSFLPRGGYRVTGSQLQLGRCETRMTVTSNADPVVALQLPR